MSFHSLETLANSIHVQTPVNDHSIQKMAGATCSPFPADIQLFACSIHRLPHQVLSVLHNGHGRSRIAVCSHVHLEWRPSLQVVEHQVVQSLDSNK